MQRLREELACSVLLQQAHERRSDGFHVCGWHLLYHILAEHKAAIYSFEFQVLCDICNRKDVCMIHSWMICDCMHVVSCVTERMTSSSPIAAYSVLCSKSMTSSSPKAVYSVLCNRKHDVQQPKCSILCGSQQRSSLLQKSVWCTCVNKYSHKLSASHDELWHHVNIVVSAGPQLGGRFLTWPEALIQLHTRV